MIDMYNSQLICPKCGHEFTAKLRGPDMQLIHVAAPGTASACPSCGATFSVAEGYPKEDLGGNSLRVVLFICALIPVLAIVWWMLR